jgi:hypothetical protein
MRLLNVLSASKPVGSLRIKRKRELGPKPLGKGGQPRCSADLAARQPRMPQAASCRKMILSSTGMRRGGNQHLHRACINSHRIQRNGDPANGAASQAVTGIELREVGRRVRQRKTT